MQKYMWSSDSYMCTKANMGTIKAKDDNDAIIQVMLRNEGMTKEELMEEVEVKTDKELVEYFKDINGDGQPYYTIKNMKTDLVIFGD